MINFEKELLFKSIIGGWLSGKAGKYCYFEKEGSRIAVGMLAITMEFDDARSFGFGIASLEDDIEKNDAIMGELRSVWADFNAELKEGITFFEEFQIIDNLLEKDGWKAIEVGRE